MVPELIKQPKISHFVDFDWENALKWLEWCIFRVQGMPNPMVQVSSLYDKWFLKNQNFRQKFHILLILTGKMHWNGLSGAYLGFKACQIQWHRFQVSMISGSWKIKILGDKYHKMGLKTIKIEWDLCSSPPWVPFYPYTMFQNPLPKPSCQKSRKIIITQKVLVTQQF